MGDLPGDCEGSIIIHEKYVMQVMIDAPTGRSRGFGFVSFKHSDSVDKAIKERHRTVCAQHVVDDDLCDSFFVLFYFIVHFSSRLPFNIIILFLTRSSTGRRFPSREP